MKQTKKYVSAIAILTYPHSSQDELYQELNRLGWFWDSKKQKWERNNSLKNDEETNLIRIRVWSGNSRIDHIVPLIIEAVSEIGLRLEEQSVPYVCRPPRGNESRVYLTFSVSLED